MNALAQMRRRIQAPLPRGDQKMKFFKHPIDRTGLAVVPGKDALGGIASADEVQLAIGLSAAQLSRDVDEKAAFRYFDPIEAASHPEHFDPLVKGRAVKFFMRIASREHADDFVDRRSGRIRQSHMSARRGIERARQDSGFHRIGRTE
jgi:hypothetical protein